MCSELIKPIITLSLIIHSERPDLHWGFRGIPGTADGVALLSDACFGPADTQHLVYPVCSTKWTPTDRGWQTDCMLINTACCPTYPNTVHSGSQTR